MKWWLENEIETKEGLTNLESYKWLMLFPKVIIADIGKT
jgi:hypothetical protein